jgi:LmbE family N-acetylglucosaminyl deacetylase
MPTVLAVSPHLDDVAFSCGGVLGVLRRTGWQVRVATVFTATVNPLSPFALACQLDKGLPTEVDYMALRRGEDVTAMRCLGVDEFEHLGLPEAPHRGYTSAADLFAGRHDDDRVLDDVREAVLPLARNVDLLLGPQGLGDHVDHQIVVEALTGLDVPTLLYRDTPYAMRLTTTGQQDAEVAVPIDAALADKIAACTAYASQLGFQFGGRSTMAAALEDFAEAEARRCGWSGVAEVLAGSAAARDVVASS